MALTVAVFGSSQPRPGNDLYEDAVRIGAALAFEGWTVLNGGYAGVMEASARGAKQAGGRTRAVTTAVFRKMGIAANPFIDDETVAETYGDRLLTLIQTADAYVVMRGGSGTLAELFLAWELVKNGSLPHRPIVLFGEHWPRVIEFLARELSDEAAFRKFRNLLSFASQPGEVASRIRQFY